MIVRTVPVQPHCFLYGGFDIQMVRTHEALQSIGIDARPLDFWARDVKFDILHVWGLERRHRDVMRIAKDYGKKVVMTPLLPYLTPRTYLSHWAGRTRSRIEILQYVDIMLVVNQLQADTAVKIFGFPRQSIEIIPTILNPLFFDSDAEAPTFDGHENYFVCAGNILPRKNQIRLAQAALKANCSVVFVGNTMGGEEAYAAEFSRIVEANPRLIWYKWLSWESLNRILRNCTAVALPSFNECQPASGLEAAALQKPLLLAKRPYARQEFYSGALLVDPKSVDSIAAGLEIIMADPRRYTLSRELVNDCRPDFVALKLRSIFESFFSS
jgi:glycosyltransferase involved in cell wall biosynthesis